MQTLFALNPTACAGALRVGNPTICPVPPTPPPVLVEVAPPKKKRSAGGAMPQSNMDDPVVDEEYIDHEFFEEQQRQEAAQVRREVVGALQKFVAKLTDAIGVEVDELETAVMIQSPHVAVLAAAPSTRASVVEPGVDVIVDDGAGVTVGELDTAVTIDGDSSDDE